MNLAEYNKLQEQQNSNIIAIDFDGVVHKSSKGFFDGTIYDEPIPGALESIKKLYDKGYQIVIYTCKAKPDRPLVNDKTGSYLVWEWLNKHKIGRYIADVTSDKPRALIYIDDKGYRFTDWTTTLNFIDKL